MFVDPLKEMKRKSANKVSPVPEGFFHRTVMNHCIGSAVINRIKK